MRLFPLLRVYLATLCVAAAIAPAAAQTPEPSYKPNIVVSDINPQPVKTRCWDTAQAKWLACPSGGGGGGGGGDASAANQSSQLVIEGAIRDRIGDLTSPATGSSNQRLAILDTRLQSVITALGTPLQAGGSVAIAGTLPAFASTPTVNLGSGGLGTSGAPIYTTSSATAVGAIGGAAPTNATQHGGRDPAGTLRALALDTGGRLLPGQGVVASARTTLTAATATSISSAVSGRIGLTITTEAALTANLFICTTQATSCSATNYDFLLPSGASAGASFTALFAPNSSIYAYSTAAAVVVVGNWTAQ